MTNVVTDKKKINDFLNSRFIDKIYPSSQEAATILSSGNKLKFYLGIDPTGPDIHLGHMTNFFILNDLADLGHEVILLVGDFTALVGDPTDKEATRKVITPQKVKENMDTYKRQVSKILKGELDIRYNSDWLNKMELGYFMSEVAREFTVQQLILRDMFQKRIKEGKPITVEEFLYPLLQGYDSVAMEIDGEIGGTDQTFNMLVGRDLLKERSKNKIVITTPLLEDPETNKKIMNKSEGSYVSLQDSQDNIFGKVMSMPDSYIMPLLNYATRLDDADIKNVKIRIDSGENPKILKELAAFEIVKIIHGEESAKKAGEEFRALFSEGQIPEKRNEVSLKDIGVEVAGLNSTASIVGAGLNMSKSEVKRLIEQGGVKVNNVVIIDSNEPRKVGDVIRVGPRRFIEVKE